MSKITENLKEEISSEQSTPIVHRDSEDANQINPTKSDLDNNSDSPGLGRCLSDQSRRNPPERSSEEISENSAEINKPDKKKKKKKNKNKSTPVVIRQDSEGANQMNPGGIRRNEVSEKFPAKPQNPMAKLAQERLQRVAEETARLKALQDEEDRKIREEEEKEKAEIKAIADEKARLKKIRQDKILEKKKAGTYMTKSEKEKEKKRLQRLDLLLLGQNLVKKKDSISTNQLAPNTSDEEEFFEERVQETPAESEETKFRSPIVCIMGHVDTGKTTFLDNIRSTNVQDGEAGGITQQIGATCLSRSSLVKKTKHLSPGIKINGLLMIDTPGHEAFSNLRSRGSSICDMAVVIVDIVHGLEPQTIESIKMLVKAGTNFTIGLNKIDRLYGWKSFPDKSVKDILGAQDDNTISEFKTRVYGITGQLMEQGLNSKLYWENDSPEDTLSICPISAVSGEGIGDLLMNLIVYCQDRLTERITWKETLQCTVLESKETEGCGSTIDVILVNGHLNHGDRIAVSTLDGPIVTTIRSLLTPPPDKESRVKSEYVQYKQIKGSMGVKIVAHNLNKVIPGTPLMVVTNDSDEEQIKINVQYDLENITMLQLDQEGVTVHASTLGALEALLQFLKKDCDPPIPVSQATIGTIYKKDLLKTSLWIEKGKPEYATVLAFDVKIDKEAEEYAKNNDVNVFTADIIYHLFDKFKKYMEGVVEKQKKEALQVAVFPCVLKIIPNNIFNKKNPIVMGVEVVEGNLHIGTPLSIPSINLDVGVVVGIQHDHKDVEVAKKGSSVCIKIDNQSNPSIMYGRHFDDKHELCSTITRKSIDALKEHFKKDLAKEDLILLVKLKKLYMIEEPKKL